MNRTTAKWAGSVLIATGAGAAIWIVSIRDPVSRLPKSASATSMQHSPATTPNPSPTSESAPAKLLPVETQLVCMVNNRLFATPQIPVVFEGRTYYGCCEGCKNTLATDARARMAVDPLTGQDVDKALASIGAMPDGRVFYFASPEHREAFDPVPLL